MLRFALTRGARIETPLFNSWEVAVRGVATRAFNWSTTHITEPVIYGDRREITGQPTCEKVR